MGRELSNLSAAQIEALDTKLMGAAKPVLARVDAVTGVQAKGNDGLVIAYLRRKRR